MAYIIDSVEELSKTVKINQATQFAVVEPFLQSARDLYLVRYLSTELVEVLEEFAIVPDPDAEPVTPDPDAISRDTELTALLALTRKSLGPLSVWLGNAELSVRISDGGFTVSMKQGETLAASDTKIGKVEDSLQLRGFQYLDKVLEYLEANAEKFPEWTLSRYYSLRAGNYIISATQFQDIGLVDINYSRLTFESLRPVMSMIEIRFITELLGDTLDIALKAKITGTPTAAETSLINAIRRFVACKSAEFITNPSYSNQIESKEYRPKIQPIKGTASGTMNYYTEQAEFYYAKIQQIMNDNAVEFGIEVINNAMDFNTSDMKLFNAEG